MKIFSLHRRVAVSLSFLLVAAPSAVGQTQIVAVAFDRESELSSSTSEQLKDIQNSLKQDESLGVILSDGSRRHRNGSLKQISQKLQVLKVYQELIRSGVQPSRIVIKDSSDEFVTLSLEKNVSQPVAALPGKIESAETAFTIHFDSASAIPKMSQEKLLVFLSNVGGTNRDAIVIEGYTDSVGNAVYNKALGELRALSVFELLVKNGLPAYRVDTKTISKSSEPGKGTASAEDRKVVIKWTENQQIAAVAAASEESTLPAEVATPIEPVKKDEPAPPIATPVSNSIQSSRSSLLDLVATAGGLFPGGEFSRHAKTATRWGVGIGKDFWTNETDEIRATVYFHANTELKAKGSALSGPVDLQSYAVRGDYVFGKSAFRPFVGLGVAVFDWEGSILQNSTQLRNTGSKNDTASIVALGIDMRVSRALFLAPELTWYEVGGDFSETLYSADISLRWKI